MDRYHSANFSYLIIDDHFERTIVIGDIHGCYREFTELLETVCFSENDLVISVGDLVDRGSGSWEVAEFFRSTPNAFSVAGNHERRIAGVVRGTSTAAWSQLHTLSKIDTGEHDAWASFFESLPAVIETEQVIVTHARLDPSRAIQDQVLYHTCAVGGPAVEIETDLEGVPIWFREWNRRFPTVKPICMGHIGYERVELVPGKLFALDTGAVRAGKLTALVLPGNKVISVECANDYYKESRQEWMESEFERLPIQSRPLHRMFRLGKKAVHDSYDERLLHMYEEYIESMNIPARVSAARNSILATFGAIPPPGPERGKYYIEMRQQLPASSSRFVGLILSPKPFQVDALLKLFAGRTLGEVDQILVELEDWLRMQAGPADDFKDEISRDIE